MEHLIVIYNHPPWLCKKSKLTMLSLLIFNSLCNDIDVYLLLFIDDIHMSFKKGVETYDAYAEQIYSLCSSFFYYKGLPCSRYSMWMPLQHIYKGRIVCQKNAILLDFLN